MEVKRPKFFGISAEPPKHLAKFLSVIPFVLVILLYLYGSHARRLVNVHDKILPPPIEMVKAVGELAFTKDKRFDSYIMLEDTKSSVTRLIAGMLLATLLGLFVGVNLAAFRGLEALFINFSNFAAIIPPLAILPILFVVMGVGESAKIALIFLGTFPMITLSVYQAAKKLPAQQKIKALTMGASDLQIVYKVMVPQLIPHLLESMRLSFGAGWLFLISAEAISSSVGLGYRIFLVRRYLAMDIIIPYTIWITLIGFLISFGISKFIKWRYPWYTATK